MCLQLFVQISNFAIQQQRTRWELHWRKVANSFVIFWRRLRNGWDGVWKPYDPCLHMWNYVCTSGHVRQCCCSFKGIQTNSWYLWAKQKPGFFSSQAIVTWFFLNHIKKLYTSGTLLIVQKSFVLSGLRRMNHILQAELLQGWLYVP